MFLALSSKKASAIIKPKLKHYIALGPVGTIRTLGSSLLDFIVSNGKNLNFYNGNF